MDIWPYPLLCIHSLWMARKGGARKAFRIGAMYKPRGQNLGQDTLLPLWTFLLNCCYQVLWFTEQPPFSPHLSTWLVHGPIPHRNKSNVVQRNWRQHYCNRHWHLYEYKIGRETCDAIF